MSLDMTRRRFLATGAAAAGTVSLTGGLLTNTVTALAAEGGALDHDRVLVVIQLEGGNDGLNTVIPYADDAYFRVRPNIALAPGAVLALNDHVGLHPEMLELRALYHEGGLAVLQNVGYPRQNRSHFTSTDIWNKAAWFDPTAPAEVLDGWLGRYFAHYCADVESPLLGLQIGSRSTLAFASANPRGVTIENPEILAWQPFEDDLRSLEERARGAVAATADNFDYVRRLSGQTLDLAQRVHAARAADSRTEYAPFDLSQSLRLVGQMIAAQLPTRVFFVTLTGFDTHIDQNFRHRAILQELSQAIGAFAKDMKAAGHWDRTTVMTYSEFGRRVAENGTKGTDHGAASVMFVAGGAVAPGVHGTLPNLAALEDGDLAFDVDFRSVYAAVLQDWFGVDPAPVLFERFDPAPVLRTARRAASA